MALKIIALLIVATLLVSGCLQSAEWHEEREKEKDKYLDAGCISQDDYDEWGVVIIPSWGNDCLTCHEDCKMIGTNESRLINPSLFGNYQCFCIDLEDEPSRRIW